MSKEEIIVTASKVRNAKYDGPARNYDLMNVIIARRGNNEGTSEIFDYLTAFFTSDIDGICRHVDIRDDVEAVEGIKQMTGLGQSIYDKAYDKAVLETLISLVQQGLLNLEDAAKQVNMSKEEFSELLKEKK